MLKKHFLLLSMLKNFSGLFDEYKIQKNSILYRIFSNMINVFTLAFNQFKGIVHFEINF